MPSLPRTWIVAVATALLVLTLAEPASAQSGRRRARSAAPKRASSAGVYAARVSPAFRTFSPYDAWRESYPKYFGGIHAREYNEMLYPTGDRPVRGTAW